MDLSDDLCSSVRTTRLSQNHNTYPSATPQNLCHERVKKEIRALAYHQNILDTVKSNQFDYIAQIHNHIASMGCIVCTVMTMIVIICPLYFLPFNSSNMLSGFVNSSQKHTWCD